MTEKNCTSCSAYLILFTGRFQKLKLAPIWKARAEPKCCFFTWTLLHKKILMANNLQKRGWPHSPTCSLCNIHPETPAHLCKDFSYTRKVWAVLSQWLWLTHTPGLELQGWLQGSIYKWWCKAMRGLDKRESRKRLDGVIVCFGGIYGTKETD